MIIYISFIRIKDPQRYAVQESDTTISSREGVPPGQ